jgi:hypothetical protein
MMYAYDGKTQMKRPLNAADIIRVTADMCRVYRRAIIGFDWVNRDLFFRAQGSVPVGG